MEALCLPVCLRPIRTGAEMSEAPSAAGQGRRRVLESARCRAGPLFAEHGLDVDAVAAVEGNGTDGGSRRRGGGAFSVREHFGVGEAGCSLVNGDVDVLPTRLRVHPSRRVGVAAGVVADSRCCASACRHRRRAPPQLLDVRCGRARPAWSARRADGAGFEPPAGPSGPSRESGARIPEHGSERHPKRLSDLRRSHPQPALSLTMTATRSGQVRLATRRGAEERSRS